MVIYYENGGGLMEVIRGALTVNTFFPAVINELYNEAAQLIS